MNDRKLAIWQQNRLDAIIEHGYSTEVVNNPSYFNAEMSSLKWEENAPNNGAVEGTNKTIELQPGDKFVRYDTLDGSYFAPVDSRYETLALPYDENSIKKTYWEVDKPFDVEQSTVAPAFGSTGGGIQYRLNSSEKRVTNYNEEHLSKDSPSSLAYEGFIHKIKECGAVAKSNQKLLEEVNSMSVRDMLKGMGHEASPPSEQTQEKYSETENPSSTHVRDMLKGQESEVQASKIENENEND
jgi:hypothetical protein